MSKSHFTKSAGFALAAALSLTTASFAADNAPAPAQQGEATAQPVEMQKDGAEAPAPAAAAPAETVAETGATPANETSAPAAAPQKAVIAPPAAAPAASLKAAELSLGALVFGADGKDVGKIVRISSAANGSVTEIQIDTGKAGVVVVPANAIANGGAKVKLSLTSDQVGKLPAAGG